MPVYVEKAEVCLFQGVTVLEPGQSLVQYLEGELCYTVHCLHHRDPESGFYAMDVSSVNCSQKCGPVWWFFDAFEHFIYHQYGPAVLHAEPLFMCSTRCTSRPLTLRCAVAPAKISPARLLMKTGLRIFSLYELHIHLLFAPLIIYLFIYFLSGTGFGFLCRQGVPGWRTVLVTTAWRQQWEQWYWPLGLFVHLLMTQSVFRFGPLKRNANNEVKV